MKTILLILIFVAALCAQVPSGETFATFTAPRATTGTTEKVTIQQPASASRRVKMLQAYVYCSLGCDVDQSRDGTAATTTALTVRANNPALSATSKANAFHTSNVGAGTAIGTTVTLSTSTGLEKSFDLSGIYMMDDGTAYNYTIAVSAAGGGTIRVVVKWAEY